MCTHNRLLAFQVSWDSLEHAFTLYSACWIDQFLHGLRHLQQLLSPDCWTLLIACYIHSVQILRLQNQFCDFCDHAMISLLGI
jgi:hypothetical protein